MSAEKMVKNEARAKLSGKWAAAEAAFMTLLLVPIIVTLAVVTAYGILGETEVREIMTGAPLKAVFFVILHVAAVAALVLLSPLYNGFVRFFAKTACGEDADMSDVFWFFESKQRYKSAVVYMAGVLVRCLGMIIACEAPAIVVFVLSQGDDSMMFIAITLAILGAVGAFVWLHRFALQMMLFSYYDYDGASAAMHGMRAAKGNIGKLLMLTVTFAPWLLSTYFVVPLLYVGPYMTCAYFVSAKYILSGYLEALSTAQEVSVESTAAPIEQTNETAQGAVVLDKEPAEQTNETAAQGSVVLDKAPVEQTNETAAQDTLL